MLLLVRNEDLTYNREKTYLTAAVSAAATTLTVQAVDTNAWADNDWIIVGEIGTKNAEVLQINGVVSDGTSLTIDNAGSGGARYAHSIDEPVYRIDYNRVEFSRAATETGAKTVLATNEIQPDDKETRYDDTTNTTGFGFARWNNSASGANSPYSDAMPYAGQTARSLTKLIQKIRTFVKEPDTFKLSDEEIIDAINDWQRDIAHERLWSFYEIERSFSAVANQFAYDLDTAVIKALHTVRFETQPLAIIDHARWDIYHWDTDTSTADPSHAMVWNNQLKVYPRPSTAAGTTALNGALTAASTTITVDSTSSFKRGDYFRFIIDSEVIYATASTSTTFTGCVRAREGTTASTHADDATVTERDIVYTAQVEPTDLSARNDETAIPEPLVLCLGVSSDLAITLEKETLHDRLQARYERALKRLKDRYELKITGAFNEVKDEYEVVSPTLRFRNPNDTPTNVSAS